MTSRRRVLQLALALLAATSCGETQEAGAVEDPGLDPRVSGLLRDCIKDDFYGRNVSDVIPLLMEKLERGARDPLKRAKEQLAEAGEAAIAPLSRFVDEHYAQPQSAALMQNALDVLRLSKASGARDILLRCLDHPGDSVRLAAVQGLQLGHARPEDFDLLLAHLDVEIPEQRHQVALALHSADPDRAEALYLDWIRGRVRTSLHPFVAPLIGSSRLPATATAAAELYGEANPGLRAQLAAPAAAAGDQAAAAFLAAELELDEVGVGHLQRRTQAVLAASHARLGGLLARSLVGDPDHQVRTLAAMGIAETGLSEEGRQALRVGLDDFSPVVRAECLGVLVEAGDAAAIDRALGLLSGPRADLEAGMRALMRRLDSDPDLASRALETLVSRDEVESFLPLGKRLGTLKSLGQIPMAEAAQHLVGLARDHSEQRVEGLRVHEWLTMQAGNTGPEGRAVLAQGLAGESDARRRMDLLAAASAARTDAVRDFLLARVESGELSEFEVLFACDRLARLGPAQRMAPRLKRTAARLEDAQVVRAMHCLLWRWY